MRNEKPPGARQQAGIGAAMSFGMTFAAGMAAFTALGWWIDKRRGGGQAFTLAGMFAGLFYGGYEVWKLVRQLQSKPENGEGEGGRTRPGDRT